MSLATPTLAAKLAACLKSMDAVFRADPDKAVRSQSFIKLLHAYLHNDLTARLSRSARTRGVDVQLEPKVMGARSQMSSIGNNTLGYIDGIIGEAESLQKRFPMSVHGYVYCMPKEVI